MQHVHPSKYSVEEQEKIFSGFWSKFSEQIVSGRGVVDFPSGSDLQPHHITTVIRLPSGISEKLHKELSDIFFSHYHYPAEDIHLTLINLDKLLGDQKNVDWQELDLCISKEVRELPQLQFHVRGMGVFPTTILAQIYDTNSTLELYRAAIIKGVGTYLSKEIDITSITALVPGITFANLVRFKSKPEPSIVELIGFKREKEFGSFHPTKFEIVTTNKLLSTDGTITNAVVQLGK
jgi:hypothetical protein